MTTEIIKFEHKGHGVRGDDERRMLNLTDMHRADGADPSKRPAKWRETAAARDLIAHLARSQNVRPADIIVGEPGKGGSTWASPKLALAYGMYLSTEFQDHCLGIILAVYQDGGYVLPGREHEFSLKLLEQIAEQNRQIAEHGTHIRALCEWKDSKEREHPFGLMGPRDAKVLAGQMREIRDLMIKAGDERKPRALLLIVDRSIRLQAGYPKDKGAKWENATAAQATIAFSRASQWIAALRKDIADRARSPLPDANQARLFQ